LPEVTNVWILLHRWVDSILERSNFALACLHWLWDISSLQFCRYWKLLPGRQQHYESLGNRRFTTSQRSCFDKNRRILDSRKWVTRPSRSDCITFVIRPLRVQVQGFNLSELSMITTWNSIQNKKLNK